MCSQSVLFRSVLRTSGPPLLVLALALPPLGCGGGGGTGSNPTRGSIRLRVIWPDQTRALPTAANSLRVVTFAGGEPVDSRLVTRTQAAGYTEEMRLSNLTFQSYSATMTAFQNADGTGAILGAGTATTNLTPQSANQDIDLSASINSAIDRLNLSGGRAGNPIGTPIALTVSAIDATGAVLPTLPAQFRWVSGDVGAATVNSSGTVTGTQVKPVTITVTDRDTGKNVSITLQSGCPLVVTAGVEGTTHEVPFRVNEPTDALATLLTAKTGAAAAFNYVGNAAANAYTLVTLQGRKVTLTAQQTFGAISFVGWKQGGTLLTNSPGIEIDPTTLSALTLSAVYTPRSPDPVNGYLPNALLEKDTAVTPAQNNQAVRWNVNSTKITFVNGDNFTANLKTLALQGFDWWKRASSNTLTYTLLADNDFANADIVVCFTGDPFSTNCRPDRFQGGLLPVPRNGTNGRTFFMTAGAAPNAPTVSGVGKRVIHIYTTDAAAIRAIAAHELGHAYGFNGHSESPEDLMHPQGDEAYVSGRDMNTLLTIYERSRKVPGRANVEGPLRSHSLP